MSVVPGMVKFFAEFSFKFLKFSVYISPASIERYEINT